MTGPSREKRPHAGGLWLLLAPAACCTGPLLATGLATAGALALSGFGLALAALAVGALIVIGRRRVGAASHARSKAGQRGMTFGPPFARTVRPRQ